MNQSNQRALKALKEHSESKRAIRLRHTIRLARVKFGLFFDVICNIFAQGKMGTKALNRIFSKEFLGIKGFDLEGKTEKKTLKFD